MSATVREQERESNQTNKCKQEEATQYTSK